MRRSCWLSKDLLTFCCHSWRLWQASCGCGCSGIFKGWWWLPSREVYWGEAVDKVIKVLVWPYEGAVVSSGHYSCGVGGCGRGGVVTAGVGVCVRGWHCGWLVGHIVECLWGLEVVVQGWLNWFGWPAGVTVSIVSVRVCRRWCTRWVPWRWPSVVVLVLYFAPSIIWWAVVVCWTWVVLVIAVDLVGAVEITPVSGVLCVWLLGDYRVWVLLWACVWVWE